MSIITKITTQQKSKDRYNIFTDDGTGEKYAFSVDEGVLVKFQLRKGMELDDFFLTEIQYEDGIRKAYNRAVKYLSRMMRTEHEIRSFLKEKEIEDPVIQEVIVKLYEYQFLNDEQYAVSYVRTQKNTNDKGPVVIKRELLEKGIKESLIDQALKEFSYEEQFNKAQTICQKERFKNKRDSELVLKQKLEQKLLRKGYRSDIISEAISSLQSKEEDEILQALHYQGEKFKKKYANETGFQYKQKMKMALYRKGFPLDLIEDYLRENLDE
ncbi:recombination regulator RecX [Niallia sp. Krafla_26]|uniref:recombination regulator RecX n=1 Tax=Niallia sp. Krafla_26 TaxID=3064703 RepID=UPI003D18614F